MADYYTIGATVATVALALITWLFGHKLTAIKKEVKEALTVIDDSLKDGKISKEEAIAITREARDVFIAIRALFRKE